MVQSGAHTALRLRGAVCAGNAGAQRCSGFFSVVCIAALYHAAYCNGILRFHLFFQHTLFLLAVLCWWKEAN